MKLRVIWFVPPPLAVIAADQGFCAARGLDVEPLLARGSDQQLEALASGEADATVTAMDNILMWNRRGAVDDVRIVAQMEAATGFLLVARAGITDIAQLRGAHLLVDSAENGFSIVLRAMLHDAGIGPGDYRMQVVGGVRERFQTLISGTGDATLLASFLEADAKTQGYTTLARVDDVYPGFPGQGLATRISRLNDTGPALVAWLDAMQEARVWCDKNPDAARAVVAEAGFSLHVAEVLLASVAADFRTSADGVEQILSQRLRLGLPGADGGAESMIDGRLHGLDR